MIPREPGPPLFPYTTLFRSQPLDTAPEVRETCLEVPVLRGRPGELDLREGLELDRKSTRLNSSHSQISYAVFCLKKKKHNTPRTPPPRGNAARRRCRPLRRY